MSNVVKMRPRARSSEKVEGELTAIASAYPELAAALRRFNEHRESKRSVLVKAIDELHGSVTLAHKVAQEFEIPVGSELVEICNSLTRLRSAINRS